jgi:hypothetical protein
MFLISDELKSIAVEFPVLRNELVTRVPTLDILAPENDTVLATDVNGVIVSVMIAPLAAMDDMLQKLLLPNAK